MGFGKALAIGSVILGRRAAEKFGKRVFNELPKRGYRAFRGDPDNESELASILSNAHNLARMIKATYKVYKYSRDSEKAYDVLEGIRNDLNYEIVPAEEFEVESDEDHTEEYDEEYSNEQYDDLKDVRELLNDHHCHVLVYRKRLREGQVKIVVAVRGTNLLCPKDLKEDLKIPFESLHLSERLDKIDKLVRELIRRYGRESICLTGHSLGAALAFFVARQLYLDNLEVEGHFFALPFMPLDRLYRKIVSILSTSYWISSLLGLDEHLTGFKAKINKWTGFDLRTLAEDAKEEFNRLVDWHPHIYVQKFDVISNGYIEFFQKTSSSEDLSESTAFVHRLGRDRKVRYLCPSAILITGRSGLETLTSHGIKHWMDVEPLRFEAVRITDFDGQDI